MNWFIFSLLSIVALALAELVQQHLLNNENPIEERSSGVFTFLFQAIVISPLLLLTDLRHELFTVFAPIVLPYTLTIGLIASFAMVFYLRSFKVKNLSISTLFMSSSIVVSTLLGILIFSESFSPIKIIAIGLILLALLVINISNTSIEKNNYFGLLAGLLFGITFVIDKFIVLETDPFIYLFWSFILIALFGTLFNLKQIISTITQTKLRDYQFILYSGLGYLFFNIFTFNAYTVGGDVGSVDAINNAQTFLIILVELLIFKQKEHIIKKIVAATIAFIGIMLLGFFT